MAASVSYERDSVFIPAHGQPALLIDLVLSRGIHNHRLLRGTGLFYEDIASGQALLAASQYLDLIGNARRLLVADDTSFLFGHRLWPGHYGPASDALRTAANLGEALESLVHLQVLLSPLAALRVRTDEQQAYLSWRDSCGAGEQWPFLLEALCAGLVNLCDGLAGERLPWRFDFRHPTPRHLEQYWVHLGEQCRFDQPVQQLCLPLRYLTRPRAGVSPLAGRVATDEARRQVQRLGFSHSLIDSLYAMLRDAGPRPPNLEAAASGLGMSATTLKRKLQRHGTGFQTLLDEARRDLALDLYQLRGWDHEAVARYLNLQDPANFRRALKRWTGTTPSLLRRLLQGG
ncbi:AraC family transcriptional regulator [Pseudomonas massiliensis]|uniref:AraC family transcriptional regulator n=1 Tax=Pseudomonas massiliensis TaxID=522492 RepID=UPI00058F3962|nr:AraC family transcriptional regulator [Pseudomonas massiliensis]